jgi:hypothetical protein
MQNWSVGVLESWTGRVRSSGLGDAATEVFAHGSFRTGTCAPLAGGTRVPPEGDSHESVTRRINRGEFGAKRYGSETAWVGNQWVAWSVTPGFTWVSRRPQAALYPELPPRRCLHTAKALHRTARKGLHALPRSGIPQMRRSQTAATPEGGNSRTKGKRKAGNFPAISAFSTFDRLWGKVFL